MPPGSAFYDWVQSLSTDLVIDGGPSGSFDPGGVVTRGLFSRWEVRALGVYCGVALSDPDTAPFEDVLTTADDFQYITTLYDDGIVSGYDEGGHLRFKPDYGLTRGQVAKMIVGATSWRNEAPGASTFSDVPQGSTFYRYVEVLARHGIIGGYPDGTFRPDNPLTRGQVARMLALTFQGQQPPCR